MVSDISRPEKKPITLITGGSAGIGRSLADLFADRGDRLYLIARDRDRLRIAADEIETCCKNEVHIASIDLLQQGAAQQLLERIDTEGFYVDILVNSAAIAFVGRFSDTDKDSINAIMQINLMSTTELIHHCIIGMQQRNAGGVLNIASFAGLLPVPNLAAYSASKSYLISLTRALAEEMRGSNVKVSVVIPGPIDTKFLGSNIASEQRFVPMLSAEGSARVGFEGFLAGQTVITPGFLGMFYRMGIKILPHKLLIRILKPILNKVYAG